VSLKGDEAFPVRPSNYESGVSVVKCVVDECYMISCGLLSASLNMAVLQEWSHLWCVFGEKRLLSLSLRLSKINRPRRAESMSSCKNCSCKQRGLFRSERLYCSADVTQMSKHLILCCFTAPTFPDKMSPIKALTMKDYENVSDLYHGFILYETCITFCDLPINVNVIPWNTELVSMRLCSQLYPTTLMIY